MDLDSFRTPDRAPVTAVTAGEMRGVDRVVVETYGVDGRVVPDRLRQTWMVPPDPRLTASRRDRPTSG
jgi:hypothetical protein